MDKSTVILPGKTMILGAIDSNYEGEIQTVVHSMNTQNF